MGNFECKECLKDEIDYVNEIISGKKIDLEGTNKTKTNPLIHSREDLKISIEKKYSALKKQIENKENTEEQQNRIIETQNEKILEQQKLIELYEQQQKLLLNQQINQLRDKEEYINQDMEQNYEDNNYPNDEKQIEKIKHYYQNMNKNDDEVYYINEQKLDTKQSNIESYEPEDQFSKMKRMVHEERGDEEEKNNLIDNYDKIQGNFDGPRDNEKYNLRRPIKPKEYDYEKKQMKNDIKNEGPMDMIRNNNYIPFKNSFSEQFNNDVESKDNLNSKKTGPRDSQRKKKPQINMVKNKEYIFKNEEKKKNIKPLNFDNKEALLNNKINLENYGDNKLITSETKGEKFALTTGPYINENTDNNYINSSSSV